MNHNKTRAMLARTHDAVVALDGESTKNKCQNGERDLELIMS